MEAKKCRWVAVLLLLAAVVAGGALAAECEEACNECSADPAFVQRDTRSPEMVWLLRRVASPAMRKEGIRFVAWLSDVDDGCPADEKSQAGTLVLVGLKGSIKRLPVKSTGLSNQVITILGVEDVSREKDAPSGLSSRDR